MQTVGEHAFLSGQPVLVVYVQIAAAVGEQLFYPGYFIKIFAQMGVQVGVRKFLAQALHLLKQRRGAGGRKAWRNGVTQPLFAVPALNQRSRLAVALFRAFQQGFRRMAIHHHLTGNQAHVQRRRLAEQRFNRLRMHGAKYQRRSGAVA
ncbi:hypothetical protein D3C78_1321450 [compost metagenome]